MNTDQYMSMLDTCPACGYKTVLDEHDICWTCGWQDDYVQRRYPDMEGANGDVTLRQAQINWTLIRAYSPLKAERRRLKGCPPVDLSKYELNPDWRPLPTAND